MANKQILYHGSPEVVRHPLLSKGKSYNDYGQGFYCTPIYDLAGEWACKTNNDGFINEYRLATNGLKKLDLLNGSYTALHWMALLLANRKFTLSGELAQEVRALLLERFLINTAEYDIVIGYRADDAYFAYAEAFVEGALSLDGLEVVLRLGQLGEQTVLISQRAFDALEFTQVHTAAAEVYYPKFIARDSSARATYRKKVVTARSGANALFALDIVRMKEGDLDARIRRIAR